MHAMEEAQVSYTIWCYQHENTNKYGDGWNGEDLSLFSKDQVEPGDEDNRFAGGRSLLAAIWPYPFKVAGDVLTFSFLLYRKDRRFTLKFKADHSLETKETIIFLPKYQYPHGLEVKVKKGGGSFEIDWDSQTLNLYAYRLKYNESHCRQKGTGTAEEGVLFGTAVHGWWANVTIICCYMHCVNLYQR